MKISDYMYLMFFLNLYFTVKVRYEGTMRGFFSGNVTDRGYCAIQSSVLPIDEELHPWTILPLNFRSILAGSSAIVKFSVIKCVSDKNGIFPLGSKAALLECNMIAIIALFIICRKMS